MGKPREIGDLFSAKNIRLFIGLAYLALLFLSPKQPIGYSSYQAGDKATVAAGSAPWALLLGAIAVLAFMTIMKRPKTVASGKPAGLLRRFSAFLIDFSLLITTFGSISGLLLVYIESRRTGAFLWYFQRDYAVPMEIELRLVLFCLTLVPMILYLAYPPTCGKQTIGHYFMSIMVVSDGPGKLSLKTALKRVVFGFITLGLVWITAFCALRDPQRRMWHDKRTHSRVVFVQD
jgi:uncharacterized RDD family membrane protein YckC